MLTQVTYNYDGTYKNWIWLGYNGEKYCPSAYDLDSIFASYSVGTFAFDNTDKIITDGYLCDVLYRLYSTEIKERYQQLRKQGIFTVENIVALFEKCMNCIGYDNFKKEFKVFNETPSYRKSYLNKEWKCVGFGWWNLINNYSDTKGYQTGEECVYKGWRFIATENVKGIAPTSKTYNEFPQVMGFYNSLQRVKNWLEKHLSYLDKELNYTN